MIFPERYCHISNRSARWLSPLVAGLFAFLFAIEKVYNYDIWWHLRFGAELALSGSYPDLDTFSFSAFGEPWINTSWLFGPFSYFLHGMAGFEGLILFKACVIGLAFGGACYFLIQQGVHPLLALLFVGMAVPLTRFRFLLRPVMFMFPGAIIYFSTFYARTSFNRNAVLLLVMGALLWINLHGSGLLVPILAGCFAVEVSLRRYLSPFFGCGEAELSSRKAWALFFLLAACMLVTPNGLDFLKQLMDRGYDAFVVHSSSVVNEGAPLKWGQYEGFWFLMAATGCSFLLLRKKSRFYTLLVYLVTTWLAFNSVRFVGIAVFLHALILCLNVSQVSGDVLKRSVWPVWGNLFGSLCLLAAGVSVFFSTFTESKTYSWGLGVEESRYPGAAVQYLKEKSFSGNLFNAWEYGGYLLWNLPAAKVFVDGRALDSHLEMQAKIDSMNASQLNRYLRENSVNAAIIRKSDALRANFFNAFPDFQLALADDQSVLYLRKGVSANDSPYRFTRPDTFDVSYLVPLAKSADAVEVEAELRRAVAESPGGFSAHYQLAVYLELQGKAEAITFYQSAAAANPALAFSHFPLFRQAARFALRVGNFQAVTDLHQLAKDSGFGIKGEDAFLLGTAYYGLKRYREAKDLFVQARAEFGETENLLSNLGFVTLELGQSREAVEIFQQLIEKSPANETAYYGLALALERSGSVEARSMWQEFLVRFPKSRYAPRAQKALSGR